MSAANQKVAIVGRAARLPGAASLRRLWARLRNGESLIKRFGSRTLLEAGVSEQLVENPRYVPARGVIQGASLFDAERFCFTPAEAALLDPQHRLMMTCVWEALEDAGLNPRARRDAGVYLAARKPSYQRAMGVHDALGNELLSENQFMPLRVSRAFKLRGPSMLISTACSSGLVAVHQAVQALLSHEIDLALVGASAITAPQTQGYLYQPEGIHSAEGLCRSYDQRADGTVPGNGVGVVVLRRLSDATANREPVRAVIRGSAVNNDAGESASFTAPSVQGQARVICEALAVADVAPEALCYVEGHGSGTRLGDAVELTAIREALLFQAGERKLPCYVGSIKSNIGHLDAAAGIAGLLKASLCLEHGLLPPTAHFASLDPELGAMSPLQVLDKPAPLHAPALVGVSALGLGGTNAHVVLEAAPQRGGRGPPSTRRAAPIMLPISAASSTGLEQASAELADALIEHTLEDVARTLNEGRAAMRCRRAVVASTKEEAQHKLRRRKELRTAQAQDGKLCFLFSGLSGQRPGVGAVLSARFGVFERALRRNAQVLGAEFEVDPSEFLAPRLFAPDAPGVYVQPAVVSLQLALWALLRSLGIAPDIVLGYSLGELSAVCAAGMLDEVQTLTLVAKRAKLIERTAPGSMLAVPKAAEALTELPEGVSIAGINDRALTIVAGATDAVERYREQLKAQGTLTFGVKTERAVHSQMMRPVREALCAIGAGLHVRRPERLCLSSCTAEPLRSHDFAAHLGRHLVEPVRFTQALQAAADAGGSSVVELGPAANFASLAALHPAFSASAVVSCLQGPMDARDEEQQLMDAIARLWVNGSKVQCSLPEAHLVPLPPTPAELRRYWLKAGPVSESRSAEPPRQRAFSGTSEEGLLRLFEETFGTEVSWDDRFVELGGHSLMALQLLQRIEQSLGAQLSVRELLEASSVREVARTVRMKGAREGGWLPSVLKRALGEAPQDSLSEAQIELLIPELMHRARQDHGLVMHPHELLGCRSTSALQRLFDEALAEREQGLQTAGAEAVRVRIEATTEPLVAPLAHARMLPPATFILSTGRSGSTLLRVMLAGHSGLFCPPELHLLPYASLSQRRAKVPSRHFEQGLARALMELQGGTMAEAIAALESWREMDTQRVFERLQQLAEPRHLVDKSPSNLNRMQSLARAEGAFEGARYIHLVRHPIAVMESYVRNRFHKIRGADPLPSLDLAELDWTVTNRHGTRFLESIEPSRKLLVRYEELVTKPEPTLARILTFLGLEFEAAVLAPFSGARMIDGAGDPGFVFRRTIDPELAQAWKKVQLPRPLTAPTLALAKALGYEI